MDERGSVPSVADRNGLYVGCRGPSSECCPKHSWKLFGGAAGNPEDGVACLHAACRTEAPCGSFSAKYSHSCCPECSDHIKDARGKYNHIEDVY